MIQGLRESHTDRVVRSTQSAGCAAGGIPSSLGWKVKLDCLRVIAGLDWTGRVIRVCTLDRIKNKTVQVVFISQSVVL